MPSIQLPHEIDVLLAEHLIGRSIRQLQVLGINSLKTVVPSPDVLVGEQVRSARCDERIITVATVTHTVRIDLQRTGCVTWFDSAQTWQVGSGTVQPSVRLLLDDGTGIDFTEPAKTKRISVSLAEEPVGED